MVAGRLTVYDGDPERYLTFITSETCRVTDKYLEFRTHHVEKISNESPLFRDKFDPIKGAAGPRIAMTTFGNGSPIFG